MDVKCPGNVIHLNTHLILKRRVKSCLKFTCTQPTQGDQASVSWLEVILCWIFVLCLSAGCYKITTVFSHAQTVVLCVGCSTVLCQPTGGKARLTEGTALQHMYKLLYAETKLQLFKMHQCVCGNTALP